MGKISELVIGAIVGGVISAIVECWMRRRIEERQERATGGEARKGESKVVIISQRTVFFMVLGAIIGAGIVGGYSSITGVHPPEISIIAPKPNDSLTCDTITEDNQCATTVDINITGTPPKSAKIRVLVRVMGGDKWWVSGGEVLPEGVAGTYSISFVTLGSVDDPNRYYELVAIATEEEMRAGETFPGIPDHIAISSFVPVSVSK
jgi:hypothetical protein